MNLPYTMTVEQAASAVTEFAPKVVYPYHYRDSDVEQFKSLVEQGGKEIEVRLAKWY
jgi:L-ascorbate metabolism protein UlaG (beta-lactamase superfamily)